MGKKILILKGPKWGLVGGSPYPKNKESWKERANHLS
jgi:hypothetical protein